MAKDWMSAAEIAKESRIYGAFVLVLAGISAWDVLNHIPFDLTIITGRRKWRWPMLIYFVCRICLLLHIFAIAVNLNAISEIPCQEVTWISKVADAIGTCGSSLILALRTHAVWGRETKILIVLGALFCGQIILWCQTFRFSRAQWNPQRNVCAVISTAPKSILVSVFAYTMVFDLVILLLCTWRLRSSRKHGGIATLLIRDGIGYFCAAFGANLIQTVMASLHYNPVFSIMCLPMALVVSVIAATTVFRNVFTVHNAWHYDGTSGPTGPHSSNGGPGGFGAGAGVTPRGVTFLRGGQSNVYGGSIALAELQSGHEGHHHVGVSVHKVVEVDSEAPHYSHATDSDSLPGDHKARAL